MEEFINVIIILIPPFVIALWVIIPVVLILFIVRYIKKSKKKERK